MIPADSIRLVSYFSAAQLYDEGKDLYDCFLVLVESVLVEKISGKKSINFKSLQIEINERLSLNIPAATLDYFLQKLCRNHRIEYDSRRTVRIIENESSEDFKEKLELNKGKIESFFEAFHEYLRDNGKDVNIEDIRQTCVRWIYTHTQDLMRLVDQGLYDKTKHADMSTEEDAFYESELVDYLVQESETPSETFKIFLSLYNGALQASLLNFIPEKIEIIFQPFKCSHIILDSNFILRILGMQSPFESRVAVETLHFLKSREVKFYILRQTLEEVVVSIRTFLSESNAYTQITSRFFKNISFRMNGLWEAYRSGVPRTKFLNLSNIEKLKNALQSQASIQFIEDYDDSKLSIESIKELIEFKKKDQYREKQAKHDVALIEFCRQKRAKDILSIKDADWWVLTNDVRLSYWNQLQSSNVQECLTETQLSNLLWIQKERRETSGLSETIALLANNESLSIDNLHMLARRLNKHIESNLDDDLDKMAIVFANTTISQSDIRFLEEHGEFDDFIERITASKSQSEKALEILRQENQDVSVKLTNEQEENELLRGELNQQKILSERKKKESIKAGIRNKIEKIEYELTLYDDIRNYMKLKEKVIVRCISIISIIVIFTLLYLAFEVAYPYLNPSVQEFLIGNGIDVAWLATVIPQMLKTVCFIISLIVAMITGRRVKESVWFDNICEIILRLITDVYLFRKGYPNAYMKTIFSGDFDNILNEKREELEELKNKLEKYST